MSDPKKRICVCVLGDIGRSPRMQYHSLSLARSGFAVDIVGYNESTPHEELRSNQNINIHGIHAYKNVPGVPRVVNYFLKVLIQTFSLLITLLFRVPKCSHILVQNPPSVPALMVVYLSSRLKGSYFVIDWHNYGYSILALSLGNTHPLVRFYQFLEFSFGKLSDFDFCVSLSMKRDLKKHINKDAIVLYDRPYSFFQKSTLLDKHQFLTKLQSQYSQIECLNENETLFTVYNEVTGSVESKKTSPILVISSTSWTEDEDFQILLDALFEFDKTHAARLIANNTDLKVVCVITGKGPMKQYYMDKLKEYTFRHTRFIFPWLEAEDYPKMLNSANLGICLHKSSSGLDLPMKVVDMFGSRLPVCAYRYPSILELVFENVNGLLFDNSEGLVQSLEQLFADFPASKKLNQFKAHLESNFCKLDWDVNWSATALPVFQK